MDFDEHAKRMRAEPEPRIAAEQIQDLHTALENVRQQRDTLRAELDRLTTLDWREEVCECHACLHKKGVRVITKMILCPTCGNKRCPHASDHRLDCTDSNEPGQAGSVYAVPTEPEPEPKAFDHFIGDGRFKVVRGAYWWHIQIGDSLVNRGKFHTQSGAEEMALLLLREFRNGAWVARDRVAAETAPPTRRPLTDEEIDELPWCPSFENPMTLAEGLRHFARAIERAHKITGGNDE